MDDDVRVLERRAAAGDEDARVRLRRAWQRAGMLPSDEALERIARRDPHGELRAMRQAFLEGRLDRLQLDLCVGRWEPGLEPIGARPVMRERVVLTFEMMRAGCAGCGTCLLWWKRLGEFGPHMGFRCFCQQTAESYNRFRLQRSGFSREVLPENLVYLRDRVAQAGVLCVPVRAPAWAVSAAPNGERVLRFWTGALRELADPTDTARGIS